MISMAADHIFFVTKNMSSTTESAASGNENPTTNPPLSEGNTENVSALAPTTTTGKSEDVKEQPSPNPPTEREVELTDISVVKPKSPVLLGYRDDL